MGETAPASAEGSAAAPSSRAARPDVEISTLRDDRALRVWRHRGRGRRLVVCFSGVGRYQRRPPRLEFAKTASASGRDHVLYIADVRRSWLNAPGLIEEVVALVEAEAVEVGATQVVSMGHSLGGFSALALGGFTRVDSALALSPQLSVDPAVVPDETRWKSFRDRIETYRISDVRSVMARATQHYIIYGTHRSERAQLRLLRPATNTHCFTLPGVRHDTVMRMFHAGILDDAVQLAFGRRTRRLRKMLSDALDGVQLAVPVEEDAA
ncbi:MULTISPECIES: hypothetical protein [Gemmobacter]|jgi:hypothetical protein|uniref:Uncharacterized protein n=2 Tax=Gemmobacter TaxID=204456 RepID=A0A2T6APS6_9RHOB|nr:MULTISPECIES: hypothetical protein [Gemmobacter]OJY36273.1 MAG: hypothetical protein BGP11_07935 [Rhodobacterales bacterium 65-51]PTX45823.1 hypothetical protein C8N34_12063 [Gemmobacter caeni]TWI94128.1 hypothetical protein IQ03_04317 [Gemmobacter caeni]GHC26061.1 hypothetical protein GCM10007291_27310 [Gemmobacter nanjingensis]